LFAGGGTTKLLKLPPAILIVTPYEILVPLGSINIGILEISLLKSEGAEVAGLFIILFTYTLIMLSYKGFIKLNSKSLGRTIRNVFYGGIIYTVLISIGMAKLSATAGVLGFVILTFIVMFLLMFIYGSGLIYVGVKNRLWMILVGGIVFLIYTISLVIAAATRRGYPYLHFRT